MNPDAVEFLKQFGDIIGDNISWITTGYVSFLAFSHRKKLHRDYKVLKGEYVAKEKDITDVVDIEPREHLYTSSDIEKLSNNKFYNYIVEFTDFLEFNFSEELLQNYYKNISKAKVDDSKLFNKLEMKVNSHSATYSSFENKIVLRQESSIYHELFHLASTYNEDFVGFYQNNMGLAINEGYTELMAHRYFPNRRGIGYYDQVEIVKVLDKLIGQKKMEELYLTNNLKGLIEELNKYASLEDIQKFITNSDYILMVKYSTNNKIVRKLLSDKSKDKMAIRINNAAAEIDEFLLTCLKNKLYLDDELDIGFQYKKMY